jgi:hypothetical protein
MTLEEQAIKVLDESASDSKSNIVDELVKEFPALAGSLVKTINKRNKTNLEIPKKERISKNKILLDITSNLSKINGELVIVSSRLQAQNDLLRANLGLTASSIGNLEYNDSLLTGKLDSVLQALQMQNEFMIEKEEDQKRDDSENRSEGMRDAASSFGFNDVSKRGESIIGTNISKLVSKVSKTIFNKYILRPLLKKFAPGLLPLLTKKGLAGTLRSILPKWMGGTKGLKPNVKQLDLFDDAANVATKKPNMLQKSTKWLNNTPLVKKTKNVLGPLIRPAKTAIGNFTKDPMGGITKFFGNKGKSEIAETISKKASKKITQKVASKGMGAIPLVGNIWDLASAAYRFQQGDVVGGLLSVGSAIPVLGWGVAAIDVARDSGAFGDTGFEHGGVIQAPPILTPAEKGAVIGGSGSSDIGHIVNAASLIANVYGVNLNDSKLRNEFPTHESTGVVTLSPLAGSQPVSKDKVQPEDKQEREKSISNLDDSNDTSESKNDDIAFNWKKPSDNIEQLRYKSDHPEGTEQPNPFKEGSTLYKNFERLRLYDKSGMTISSTSNVNNVSNITPVTQTNNISDNISVEMDPIGKTKIIYVTRTVASGSSQVVAGGTIIVNQVKKDNHKLSRLILAS